MNDNKPEKPLTFTEIQATLNCVCVGSTGRLGIVTHYVEAEEGGYAHFRGFGLDGKGNWTSARPIVIATAEEHFNKLRDRFRGATSYHG